MNKLHLAEFAFSMRRQISQVPLKKTFQTASAAYYLQAMQPLENTIIHEFGLPTWYPDEEVPLSVAAFCFDAANKPLKYAVDLATQRGFNPLCRPIPCIEPNVIGFGLAVDGKFVPLMVKVGNDACGVSSPKGKNCTTF